MNNNTYKTLFTELSQEFINGLNKFNLDVKSIQSFKFQYCGGDTGEHYSYYKYYFPKQQGLPKSKFECVCSQKLESSKYFIIDINGRILTLCYYCIQAFLYQSCIRCNYLIHLKMDICDNCQEFQKCTCDSNDIIGSCGSCGFCVYEKVKKRKEEYEKQPKPINY